MATKDPTSFGGNPVIHEVYGVDVFSEMESKSDEMSQVDSVGSPKMSPNERSKSTTVMCPFWEATFIQTERRRGDGRKPESTSPKAIVFTAAACSGGRGLEGCLISSNCNADNFARLWGTS